MKTLNGIVKNGKIELTPDEQLPDGTQVTVIIKQSCKINFLVETPRQETPRQETPRRGTPRQLSGIRFEFLVHCLLITTKSVWLTGDGLDV